MVTVKLADGASIEVSGCGNAVHVMTSDYNGDITLAFLDGDRVTRLRDALTRWLETGRVEE
jgi:hypothetical protein